MDTHTNREKIQWEGELNFRKNGRVNKTSHFRLQLPILALIIAPGESRHVIRNSSWGKTHNESHECKFLYSTDFPLHSISIRIYMHIYHHHYNASPKMIHLSLAFQQTTQISDTDDWFSKYSQQCLALEAVFAFTSAVIWSNWSDFWFWLCSTYLF